MFVSTITIFEVRFGLELLPDSYRRGELEIAFSRSLEEDFQRRVLPFDLWAAEAAAVLAAHRRQAGRPVEFRDTLIAGIVIARRATLQKMVLPQDKFSLFINPLGISKNIDAELIGLGINQQIFLRGDILIAVIIGQFVMLA